MVPAIWLTFNMVLVILGCCWGPAAVNTWRTAGAKPADIPVGTTKPSEPAVEWMHTDTTIRSVTITRCFSAVEPPERSSVCQQCGWRATAGSHKGKKQMVGCCLLMKSILTLERMQHLEASCHIQCLSNVRWRPFTIINVQENANFVNNYKLTLYFSDDELGKNSNLLFWLI